MWGHFLSRLAVERINLNKEILPRWWNQYLKMNYDQHHHHYYRQKKEKSSPSSPLITNDHRRKKKMVTIISRSRLSAQIEKIPPQDSFHASKQGQHHHPQQNHLWQEYDKIKNNMNKCSNLNLNPIAPKISNKSERNFFFSLSSVASRSRCFVWTRVGNDI